MTLYLYTFCVDIGKHSQKDLQQCLQLFVVSLSKFHSDYHFICYTNFDINDSIIKKYNIQVRTYYDNSTIKLYDNPWLNLSFNKINIYKDLHDEFGIDFIWMDIDTILCANIEYVNNFTNAFIENGGSCNHPNILFNNNHSITVPRNRYIQGNFWKLNIELYKEIINTLFSLLNQKLYLRYDLQDLFTYYIYYVKNGDLSNIHILGNNVCNHTVNGLCVWSSNGNTHASLHGFEQLYYDDDSKLKSKFIDNKEIHILSFTFDSLKTLWNSNQFNTMFF